MTESSHVVILEGRTSYLAEVQRALDAADIPAEIVRPPGDKPNGG